MGAGWEERREEKKGRAVCDARHPCSIRHSQFVRSQFATGFGRACGSRSRRREDDRRGSAQAETANPQPKHPHEVNVPCRRSICYSQLTLSCGRYVGWRTTSVRPRRAESCMHTMMAGCGGKCRSSIYTQAPCFPYFPHPSRIPLALRNDHYSFPCWRSLAAYAPRIPFEHNISRAVRPVSRTRVYSGFHLLPYHIAAALQRVLDLSIFRTIAIADLLQIQGRRSSGLHVRQTRSRSMASSSVRTTWRARRARFPPQSPFFSLSHGSTLPVPLEKRA